MQVNANMRHDSIGFVSYYGAQPPVHDSMLVDSPADKAHP
jgi:hypothetical protein